MHCSECQESFTDDDDVDEHYARLHPDSILGRQPNGSINWPPRVSLDGDDVERFLGFQDVLEANPGWTVMSSFSGSWRSDGYHERSDPPLSLRNRWSRKLQLARDQLSPCWRGWDNNEGCCPKRGRWRRAWAGLKADIR